MRLARTFWDEARAQLVASWLLARGIEFEMQPYPQENPISWRLWVLEEEKLSTVCAWIDEIESGKILIEDSLQETSLIQSQPPIEPIENQPAATRGQAQKSKNQGAWLTQTLVLLLIVIHLSLYVVAQAPVSLYWRSMLLMEEPPTANREGFALQANKAKKPWPGLYQASLAQWRASAINQEPAPQPTSFFDEWDFLPSIRHGQLWRLVTPSLLHADWLHLLFNILWLGLLGTAIEPRLGSGKLGLLVLSSAIVTNLMQYLMSGYHFLGFSGVVMAMVAFAYARVRKFPWEGYPLALSTFTFVGFYLILTLCLQLLSFILDALAISSISLNIANTAHLSGLLVGWVLGGLRAMAIRRSSL